ncbi:hypothetical protein Pse7367_0652 [Thalassoporum mexicanum PCC 7367]|uniref:hypothetical protein n=1 Tax=Thalassoporum mexicanum TaxID=3457544 RepID=UPI00029F8D4D|nr:hypothetical protein [Pseudanabaena sp. PCC 7367]AFY68955.1 hypothetical protein Pse7367_0652 [Pseudanabaena sp. PCC 7367]
MLSKNSKYLILPIAALISLHHPIQAQSTTTSTTVKKAHCLYFEAKDDGPESELPLEDPGCTIEIGNHSDRVIHWSDGTTTKIQIDPDNPTVNGRSANIFETNEAERICMNWAGQVNQEAICYSFL